MNKLGTELANAWMKKTLVDLNGFSENEIPKNRDEAYKALNLFYKELDKKTAGWKIGAVAKEVQIEEGFDGPVPGNSFKETFLPSNCSIKYSEIPHSSLECEYAFEIDQDVKIDGELFNKINNFKTIALENIKMTKRELIMRISDETGLIQQDVQAVLQKSLDYIVDALKENNSVEFRNFGVFEVQVRKARVGRNPNQPEKDVIIPKRAVIKFKSGKELRSGLGKMSLDG